jgi:hypothetical protein
MEKQCTAPSKAAFGMLLIKDFSLSRSCLWHVWLLIINKSINARERLSKAFAGAPEESFNVSNNIHNVNHTTAEQRKKKKMQKTKIIIATLFLYRSSLFCNCAFFAFPSEPASGREETRDSKLPFSSCCRARAERKGKKSLSALDCCVHFHKGKHKKCAPSNIGETI